MSEALREKLKSEVQATPWPDLVPHAKRGALLLAAKSLDLLDVAVAVADDDVAAIRGWLEAGSLSKADPGESHGGRFQFVIVQPYVLAQALPDESN